MKKYCTRCGKQFEATGREVICPSCKAHAAEDAKRAAVMRAKRASWAGESVPVRISGRASTVIRRYGAAHDVPFAAALDELLRGTNYFKEVGIKWEDVEPYKSRRMKKSGEQDGTQTAQDKPQDGTQAAKVAGKPVKQAAKTAVKTRASKASKASKK